MHCHTVVLDHISTNLNQAQTCRERWSEWIRVRKWDLKMFPLFFYCRSGPRVPDIQSLLRRLAPPGRDHLHAPGTGGEADEAHTGLFLLELSGNELAHNEGNSNHKYQDVQNYHIIIV